MQQHIPGSSHHASVFQNLPLNNISDSHLKQFCRKAKTLMAKSQYLNHRLELLLHNRQYVISDWHQSCFCNQALSSSHKYMHEYVVLKKRDLSVPILLSPLMSPGWPDTAGSCKASLIALHEMKQLQFSFRTELMMGGCSRCVRTCDNTQKVEDLGPYPPSSPPLRGLGTTLPFFTAWVPSMC